jgi:hypothetical protein
MGKEKPPRTFSRRDFLKIGSIAVAGAGIWLFESKSPTAKEVSVLDPISPTPEEYRIGAPGVTKNKPLTPEKKIVSPEMAKLQNDLKLEIDNYPGRTAISVTDILTGEQIDVNGDRPQKPGCVANLLCALTAIAELSTGKATFTKEEIEGTMTTMVRYSNPSEGLELVGILGNGDIQAGIAKINSWRNVWEMNGSFYDHPPVFDNYSQGSENLIVPNEMNKVLAKLARRELFFEDWNDYAVWVMKYNKPSLNFMIPVNIPESEATVAHKVGWVPICGASDKINSRINDVGIVFANDNRFKYAISCMFQGDECLSEDQLFYGPGAFLGKLAGMSYETFTARYGHP